MPRKGQNKWKGVDPSKIRTLQREEHRSKNRLGLEERLLSALKESSSTFKELSDVAVTNEYLRSNYIRQMMEEFEIQGYVVIAFNKIYKSGSIRSSNDTVHLTWEGQDYLDRLHRKSNPWLNKNIIHASHDEFFKGGIDY